MAAKVSIALLFLCMMMIVGSLDGAEGSISCETVANSLMPCKTYLQKGGSVPASCCSGVESLNSAANTPAARKVACQCLKAAAKATNVNPQYAAALPSQCNVNIGYPISYTTNCNNVN